VGPQGTPAELDGRMQHCGLVAYSGHADQRFRRKAITPEQGSRTD